MTYAIHSFDNNVPVPSPTAQLRKDFAMPLAVIGLLVILSLTICVHFGVSALNQQSAAREQQLVKNGLALRVEEVANLVVPQTDWDDAVRFLDNGFDASWANSNINEFLNHTYGFDGEFVIDANDKPLFAAIDGEVRAATEYRLIAEYGDDLVRTIRKEEALRGPVGKKSGTDMISKPIQASAFKIVDGQLTILTATLVQPDFGMVIPSGPRSPVVLTEMHVDKPFLAQFSKRFLLESVYIRLPSQPARAGHLEIPVSDEKGKIQAYLAWTPLDPGYGMLHLMALPVLLGMLLLVAIAAIELRRIFRAARQLIECERLSRRMKSHSVV